MTAIACRNLSFGFPGRSLVSGLDLELKNHELLLISGPNGVGKSTLLQILLGFAPAKVLAGSLEVAIPKEKIAWLPQLENPEFHLPLTLRDVLEISLPRRVDDAEVEAIGLLERGHLRYAWNQASGGERKRTLLTRALLHQPRLLLLDEPMNHLDEKSRALIVTILSRYLSENSASAIVVSHDALSGQELSLFRRQELRIESDRFHLVRH